MALIGGLFDDHQIVLAGFKFSDQLQGQRARHVQLHAGMGVCEGRQRGRQIGGGEVLRAAEADFAGDFWLAEARQHPIGDGDHFAGVAQELLAVLGQADIAGVALQQLAAGNVLQLFDLP